MRKIFTILMLVLLSTLIIETTYLHVFRSSILNDKFIIEYLQEEEVSDKLREEISSTIDEASGEIETSIKERIIETVKKETNGQVDVDKIFENEEIKNLLDKAINEVNSIIKELNTKDNVDYFVDEAITVLYHEAEIDTYEIINKVVNKVIKESKFELEAESKAELDDFVNKLANKINEFLVEQDKDYVSEDLKRIKNPVPSILIAIDFCEILSIIFVAILAIAIIGINIKHMSFASKCIGVMLILDANLIIFVSQVIKDASRTDKLLYLFVDGICKDTLIIGIIYLVVGIFMIVVPIATKRVKKVD